MEKRVSKRIPAKLALRFPCADTSCSGIVSDLSENGMFINTKICFPIQLKFELLIPLKNEILNVPVKIARIVKTDDVYDGMGVEMTDLSKEYLKYLIKFNLVCQH